MKQVSVHVSEVRILNVLEILTESHVLVLPH